MSSQPQRTKTTLLRTDNRPRIALDNDRHEPPLKESSAILHMVDRQETLSEGTWALVGIPEPERQLVND